MIPIVKKKVLKSVLNDIAKIVEANSPAKDQRMTDKIGELKEIQPNLYTWISTYMDNLARVGAKENTMTSVLFTFYIIIKSLYAQEELNDIAKLFGEKK